MSELEIGFWVLVVTTAVLLTGVPIAFGLTAVAALFLLIFEGPSGLGTVAVHFFDEINHFALLTIPMFILFGAVIGSSGASRDIYEALHRWLARIPGGMVVASILACGIFSALCGSSPATAAAIGKVGIPEMRRRGVSEGLASGAIAAGGTLGILIPPSIILIVYGIATEQSIGRLFLAGVVPGAMIVAIFSVYAVLSASRQRRQDSVEPETYNLAEKIVILPRVLPFLGLILFVLYALYGGIATPSEIAAIVALLSALLVIVMYRQFSFQAWRSTVAAATRESCMILLIVGAAGFFSYTMSKLYVTQSLAEWIIGTGLEPWLFLVVVNGFLLLLGCFLPPVAIILMVMPILQPILEAQDFNMIWFAVIMTINMEIGLITPPVGMNLYVIRGVAPDIPLMTVLRGTAPFVLLMIGSIVLLAMFPGIALWLPNLLMGASL